MKIGCTIESYGQPDSFDDQIHKVVQAEKDGFESIWFGSMKEPLVTAAVAGRETSSVELMSAVVISYHRHPVALAQQALATNAATNRRFVLGIGPASRPAVERLGYSYDRSAAAMREYVTIVKAIVETGEADVKGEFYRAEQTTLRMPWGQPMPVLISALGPAMLKVAGEVADGTVTWMAGLNTLKSFIVPRITEAAGKAGRQAPRIAAGLPIAVCDDAAEGRRAAAQQFANYGNSPHYRRLIEMEGGSIENVTISGDEKAVEAQLREVAAAGATHLYVMACVVGDNPAKSVQRTHELVASLKGKI